MKKYSSEFSSAFTLELSWGYTNDSRLKMGAKFS